VGGSECAGTGGNGPDGGVYVIDISDPSNPVEVGFIRTHQDTLVGEGMQVVRLETAELTGDVLVLNHEGCGKNYKAGVSLWDVTDPLHPKKVPEHFGDFTVDDAPDRPHDANQTRSAFLWDAGDRAYLVATDDEEAQDVDIFDVTEPKHPVFLEDFDLNEFGVAQPEIGLTDSFLHDMVVKQIGGRFIMLLSYWDGGYVLLDVTDPTNPVFLGDSDFTNPDPELARAGWRRADAGGPFRLAVTTDDGGQFRANIGTNTTVEEARPSAAPRSTPDGPAQATRLYRQRPDPTRSPSSNGESACSPKGGQCPRRRRLRGGHHREPGRTGRVPVSLHHPWRATSR